MKITISTRTRVTARSDEEGDRQGLDTGKRAEHASFLCFQEKYGQERDHNDEQREEGWTTCSAASSRIRSLSGSLREEATASRGRAATSVRRNSPPCSAPSVVGRPSDGVEGCGSPYSERCRYPF